jgi:Zinc-binding loop region of homing endonuclease
LILIFSVNTNHESVAYRSFSPSKCEARGARKVTTGISTFGNTFCATQPTILRKAAVVLNPYPSSGAGKAMEEEQQPNKKRKLLGEITLPPPLLPLSSDAWRTTSSDANISFRPESSPADSSPMWAGHEELEKNEGILLSYEACPERCQALIDKLRIKPGFVTEGWCEISLLKPSKANGYAQVSAEGFNKFACLEQILLWAGGGFLGGGQQVSHLCARPQCLRSDHVVAESAVSNNRRKNCVVWIDCHCCEGKKVLVCQHTPVCIKFCSAFTSMKELLERGVCHQWKQSAYICTCIAWLPAIRII